VNFHDAYREMIQEKNIDRPYCFSESLVKIFELCNEELSSSNRQCLVSKVDGKKYFRFVSDTKESRAVNEFLFGDIIQETKNFQRILEKPYNHGFSSELITKSLYTCAMSFCCANDLRQSGDQKTPGTFFEFFIRALFSVHLGCSAQRRLPVLNMDENCWLPTDLIFDPGDKKPKFHIPVKTSTRERIIQVWAHQRVMDGAYGVGRFLGLPVILAENKLSSARLEVTEICLPNQWRLYQLFIAQMWGFAFLDLPQKYMELNQAYPLMKVKTLGDYLESDGILESFLRSVGIRK
jgi:hypothetical protein